MAREVHEMYLRFQCDHLALKHLFQQRPVLSRFDLESRIFLYNCLAVHKQRFGVVGFGPKRVGIVGEAQS